MSKSGRPTACDDDVDDSNIVLTKHYKQIKINKPSVCYLWGISLFWLSDNCETDP